ncbi:PREDICTED: uncharacterized protein LOC104601778 isoform X2 [Nelumbo nucifera]|uniref:Uncharacterized protein LOC104601778 isoform X2 n=2 Tax=Nelumbo nucifera TaxID=4432 RepID=A0A1U8ADH5_NELNU|nr:PREDICTED: uncharacterized protein LOC104601778 isoform X2 [Nelumbo nucifera]DAD21546.1 TPA_asm: hypothetical protein HUJ06_023009 [Nelumbo nucifera]
MTRVKAKPRGTFYVPNSSTVPRFRPLSPSLDFILFFISLFSSKTLLQQKHSRNSNYLLREDYSFFPSFFLRLRGKIEGNLRQATPTRLPDREMQGYRRESSTGSELSELTGRNSRHFLGDVEMEEPIWTDEKHSLYLNFMEALFVKDLYDHKYDSVDFLGWCPQKENLPDRNSSGQSSSESPISSGKFTVLQDGSWQTKFFERAKPQSGNAGECCGFLEIPQIQYFISAGKHQEVTSAISQQNGSLHTSAIGIRGNNTASHGKTTSSKQLSVCQFHLFHQESVGNSTEVSDQNFIDEDQEEKLSSPCRTKRMKSGFE